MALCSFGNLQHALFEEERGNDQLKFGTSVFHSYVHNWGCQLKYNPHLNVGWGMSDGEGMERVWFRRMVLICQLRYCTSQHQLLSLNTMLEYINQVARKNSGM